MKIGDQVQVLGQIALDDADVGVIEKFLVSRVQVKFADGWTRYYKPEEIRVIAPQAAQGAGG